LDEFAFEIDSSVERDEQGIEVEFRKGEVSSNMPRCIQAPEEYGRDDTH